MINQLPTGENHNLANKHETCTGAMKEDLTNFFLSPELSMYISQFEEDWKTLFAQQLKDYYIQFTAITNKNTTIQTIEKIFTYIQEQIIRGYRFKKLGARPPYIHLYKSFDRAGWRTYEVVTTVCMEEGVREYGIDFIKDKIIQILQEYGLPGKT